MFESNVTLLVPTFGSSPWVWLLADAAATATQIPKAQERLRYAKQFFPQEQAADAEAISNHNSHPQHSTELILAFIIHVLYFHY